MASGASESPDLEFRREELIIAKERLRLDQQASEFDHRFWHRNFGTMTTFAIAALGLALSVAQVWVANIEKSRDAQRADDARNAAQLERDQDVHNRDKKDLRDFVATNYQHVFSSEATERDRMKQLMLATFLPETVGPVFATLSVIALPDQQGTWKQARVDADKAFTEQSKPTVYVHYQDRSDASLVDTVDSALANAGFNIPGKELVTQPTKGDIRYFHEEEKDQATRLADLVQKTLAANGRDQAMTTLYLGRSFPSTSRNRFEVWIPRVSKDATAK
jgi:hypothetical protein